MPFRVSFMRLVFVLLVGDPLRGRIGRRGGRSFGRLPMCLAWVRLLDHKRLNFSPRNGCREREEQGKTRHFVACLGPFHLKGGDVAL